MNQAVSFVALGLACAVLGAFAALLVDGGGAGRSPSEPDAALLDAVGQLTRAVATLEENIDELRSGPRLEGTPPGPALGSEEVEPAAPPPDPRDVGVRGAPGSAPSTDLLVRRDALDPPLPPKNQDRVDEFGPWKVGEEARSRWLLASEASVLRWFGSPDAIYTDGGEERWVYERVVEGRRARLSIYLHRGRVIRVLD